VSVSVKVSVRAGSPPGQISRLRGTPAAFIGLIDAPDESSAIKAAIKQFDVRPEDQKRLIAVRQQ